MIQKQLLAVAEALTQLAACMEVEAITKGNLTLDGKEKAAAPEKTEMSEKAAPSEKDAAPWKEDKPAEAPAAPVTKEQARAVLSEKTRHGYTAEIKALLEKYGAPKLSEIEPKHYAALVADAEKLGGADAT